MAYTPISPTAEQIKAELDADSLGRGYAALRTAQDWNGLVDSLNEQGQRTVNRRRIEVHEFCEAIDASAIAALSAGLQNALLFLIICGTGTQLDPLNTVIRGYFTSFPAGTTRTRLQALQTRLGSRAEELWGDGVVVSDNVVEAAARLP